MSSELIYHPHYSQPPCIALGEVVVCTFPVYASDDPDMPDAKRHEYGRLFAASPELLAVCGMVAARLHDNVYPGVRAAAVAVLAKVKGEQS